MLTDESLFREVSSSKHTCPFHNPIDSKLTAWACSVETLTLLVNSAACDGAVLLLQACELVQEVLEKDRRQRDELQALYREAQQYIVQQSEQQRCGRVSQGHGSSGGCDMWEPSRTRARLVGARQRPEWLISQYIPRESEKQGSDQGWVSVVQQASGGTWEGRVTRLSFSHVRNQHQAAVPCGLDLIRRVTAQNHRTDGKGTPEPTRRFGVAASDDDRGFNRRFCVDSDAPPS